MNIFKSTPIFTAGNAIFPAIFLRFRDKTAWGENKGNAPLQFFLGKEGLIFDQEFLRLLY